MVGKMKQEYIDKGWINDRTYPTDKADENGITHRSLGMTAVYQAWTHMKQRCTNEKYKEKYPTYIGVSASAEFKNFTLFHQWWYSQLGHDLPNVELDKDLLNKGNKVYSPETCLLIPKFVNMFLVKRDAARGDCMIGVDKKGVYKNGDTRYRTGVSEYDPDTGKTVKKHLGCFRNELDAFHAYKIAKEAIAKQYAEYLLGKVDSRVIDALLNFEVHIED